MFFSWSCLTIIGSKLGPSSWSYGSWIYNDIDYIHCITTKVFEFESRSWRGVLNTTLFEKQIVFFVHGAEKKKKKRPNNSHFINDNLVTRDYCTSSRGFQYFSSLPVLHYLQAVLFIKIWTIFMNILHNTLQNQEVPKTILGG